jgi:predicted amidophosphoribosyltransferase
MFCSNCGEKLTAKAKFCAACGAPHGESGSTPTKKATSSSPKLEAFGNTGFITNYNC